MQKILLNDLGCTSDTDIGHYSGYLTKSRTASFKKKLDGCMTIAWA